MTPEEALAACLSRASWAGMTPGDCRELVAEQTVSGAYCDGRVVRSLGPNGEPVRSCVPRAVLERKAAAAAASPLPSRVASCAPCASLPSSEAAARLVDGEPGAWAPVVGTALLRAALIGAGAVVAGEREPVRLARVALGGAVAIEAFVLGWVYLQRKARARAA